MYGVGSVGTDGESAGQVGRVHPAQWGGAGESVEDPASDRCDAVTGVAVV
jgi:hypothetical protein